MSVDRDSAEGLRRILRLAPDCDPTKLALTPEEGFLLSRIDGCSPWRLLREIGGMDPDEADLCVEGWIASGIVKVEGLAPDPPKRESQKPTAAAAAESARPIPSEVDETLIDPTLDLGLDVQRRILEFECRLGLPYHELLGVDPEADPKDVKRAYFKLSREFHPDRYFRRRIAGYEARLDRIFKRILESYEILSDPELYAKVASQDAEAGLEAAGATPAPNRPPSKLERLRQRMPFRIPEQLLAERRQKAAELFRAAQLSEFAGQLQEAASSIRLAISFDPADPEYRAALVDLQARVAEKKAAELLEECTANFTANGAGLSKVLRQLEEVLLYRPHDPLLNARAALVALQLEDLAMADEYARTALEHSPDVADYHVTMGLVHKAKSEIGYAKRELEKAIELAPEDLQARKALASLRLGRAVSAQEGRDG